MVRHCLTRLSSVSPTMEGWQSPVSCGRSRASRSVDEYIGGFERSIRAREHSGGCAQRKVGRLWRTEVRYGSLVSIPRCQPYVRLAGNFGHAGSPLITSHWPEDKIDDLAGKERPRVPARAQA